MFAGSLVWRCWQEDLKQLRAGFQHCRAEGGELDREGALAFTSRKKTTVRSAVSIFQLHVFLKKKNPVFMSMLLDNKSKLEDINSHTNPIPPRYNCLKNSHTASRGAEFEEVVTTSWETQVHWSPVRRKTSEEWWITVYYALNAHDISASSLKFWTPKIVVFAVSTQIIESSTWTTWNSRAFTVDGSGRQIAMLWMAGNKALVNQRVFQFLTCHYYQAVWPYAIWIIHQQ